MNLQEMMVDVGRRSIQIEYLICIDGPTDYNLVRTKIKEIDGLIATIYQMNPDTNEKLKLNMWHKANLDCYELLNYLQKLDSMEELENGKNRL